MQGAPDEEILVELARLGARNAELEQFRSLVGAHQYLRLYQLVRRRVAPDADILDWGTGNGHFSYFLVRAGFRATGYSFSKPAFLDLHGGPTYRFALGDVSEPVAIPFADASFDAVASVGVLEHVRETGGNETASLREIERVLRPGGIFICFHFPNRYSLIDLGARHLPGAHHHVQRYTKRDIRALVRTTGLELVELRRYAILPRNLGYLLPKRARYSPRVAAAWNLVDDALGSLLSPLCTNYYFVARKSAR
jgi:SAM-dependent methyltransferase